MKQYSFYSLTPDDVLNDLINLRQIIFEVTDGCNLKCKYCGYGDIYEGYDNREFKFLSFNQVKILLDYLHNIWQNNNQRGQNQLTAISFYGGEPLLNINFIKQVVNYIEKIGLNTNKEFYFSMTTNAVLLDRYMDYLAEKNFVLLISLDGNKQAQSYRVDHFGNNSFDKVFNNIKLLQQTYPNYFKEYVNFNSVLHNRNNVKDIYEFILNEFGKIGQISELRALGVKPEKIDEFNMLYKNKIQDLHHSDTCGDIQVKLFMENPEINELFYYLISYGNTYYDYNDLLHNEDNNDSIIYGTGTCRPFSKKLFVTVNGKLLPCERIDHKFSFGYISNNKVILDTQAIANKFNTYLSKIYKNCKSCFCIDKCSKCLYTIENIDTDNFVKCDNKISKQYYEKFTASRNINYLKTHPELLKIYNEDFVIG